MINSKKEIKNIDSYIASIPVEVRSLLEKIRQTIKNAAPNAEETINYQIPTFKLNGNLVHFSANKKHIGFYPAPSAIKAFEKELSSYETSKGTIKFPYDKEIPYKLITKIVQFRVLEQKNKK